jgi:polar amino acid transport system substrate-binding protein
MAVDQGLNVQKLINNRIEGLITDDEAVIESILAETGQAAKIERHPLNLEETDLHVAFSRKSIDEATFRKFDLALQRIMSDGRLAAIAARYAAKP